MRLLIVVLAILLSGCAESGPNLRGVELTWSVDELPFENQDGAVAQKTTGCNNDATIDIELTDYVNGSITVNVRDGAGYTIGHVQVLSSADNPAHADLVGSAGLWSIDVRRSVEMDAQGTITFRC